MKIKKIKVYLKLKKISKLWLKMCEISDTLDYQGKKESTDRMRTLLSEATEAELERTGDKIIAKISELEDFGNIPVNLINKKDFSLI